jgi:hypothetical protein
MPGIAAFGASLKIGGTAGTAVVNITNIDGPSLDATILDMGSHDSPSAYMEKAVGQLDAGDVTLRINWDPGTPTHAATSGLMYYYESRASEEYALEFADGTQYVFNAYVTSFSGSAPYDGKMEATVTLTIDGDPGLA